MEGNALTVGLMFANGRVSLQWKEELDGMLPPDPSPAAG